MITVVAAGWRGARDDRHGETVRHGLGLLEELLGHTRVDSDSVLVLSGDSPHGGVDAIVQAYVTASAQRTAGSAPRAPSGWLWESRRVDRSEKLPGSGTGNYRVMMRDRKVDWLVMFPGPADADSREALSWAIRYGVPTMAFPIPAEMWGGRAPR